jgi:hypothetical protein
MHFSRAFDSNAGAARAMRDRMHPDGNHVNAGSKPRRRRRSRRSRVVLTYTVEPGKNAGHDAKTRMEIARRLVGLTGYAYRGEYDARERYADPPYFVPSATLHCVLAARLGIGGVQDLLGGVVPMAFVATKVITHPLVANEARAPFGWSAEFPRRVAQTVLDGYSAFSQEDASRAGRCLLDRGDVRLKLANGIAGLGQWVVRDAAALDRILAAIGDEVEAGVVVEENLSDVATYSVGHIRVADLTAAYCGTQQLTTNNDGQEVYGGSRLRVARGGFDLADDLRHAIAQARAYDDAAHACFPGFFASRRNYDVAQGVDARGRRRSGVLEQSWRVGGASGAEIAALEAFRADPSLQSVQAASREIYGECPAVPENSTVYFRGVDPDVGAVTKYALTEPDADTR